MNEWDNFFFKKDGNDFPHQALIVFFNRNFAHLKKRLDILDLGCGTGSTLKLIRKKNFYLDLVDISSQALRKLNKNYKSRNIKTYNQEFISYLENSNKKYDLIIDSSSLQHQTLNNVRKSFTLCKKNLKNNGYFFSIFLNSFRNINSKLYLISKLKKNEIIDLFKFNKFKNINYNKHYYTENNNKDYICFNVIYGQRKKIKNLNENIVKKKSLVIGYPRSGTHRIKEFIRYNINKNVTYKNPKKYSDPLLIGQNDIFIKNKNFYVFDPYTKKKFEIIEIKNLLKKKILSTHRFYHEIISDFKNYNLILTIRDPVSIVRSLILFNTKKEILNLNPKFKIRNSIDLANNKKIIQRYIDEYTKFYKNILNTKNSQFLNDIILIDYKMNVGKKLKHFNFKNFKIKKSKLHTTSRNKKLENYITKNYNLDNANKIYKSFLKLSKYKSFIKS